MPFVIVMLLSLVCGCTSAPAHEGKRATISAAPKAARTIHPQPGSNDCVEMYGSCTELPDQLCTSNAFALACGESGELPSNAERIVCVCP